MTTIGNRDKRQTVSYGTTASGQAGLFTNGYMAWCLTAGLLERYLADPVGYCERLGFTLDTCHHAVANGYRGLCTGCAR